MALTTTTGVSIVSTIVRTTMGIPQPWQRECPPRSGGCRSRCGRVSSGATWLSPQSQVGRRPVAALQEHVADVGRVELAAAEAVDVRIELGCRFAASAAATSAKSGGRPPGESARSRTATLSTSRSDTRTSWWGKRSEGSDLEQADGLALGAELVDDVFDRASGRAEADDHAPRVVELVRLDRRVAAAAESSNSSATSSNTSRAAAIAAFS